MGKNVELQQLTVNACGSFCVIKMEQSCKMQNYFGS